MLTLQLRNVPELRERFWAVQSRYREVAPKTFSAQDPIITDPAIIHKLSADELRARIEVLACEFFRLCMLATCRESMRKKASTRLWITTLFFLGFFLVDLDPRIGNKTGTLSAVLLAGAVGGFVSAQRRIQGVTDRGESLIDLIELSSLSSFLGNLWAPVSGAIFAVILYAMLLSGVVGGAAFPDPMQTANIVPHVFRNIFCETCGPKSGIDSAKLIIWCFIAGFAERFVPDALDRLVSKASGIQDRPTDARTLPGHEDNTA
jgi:hypothetical protein